MSYNPQNHPPAPTGTPQELPAPYPPGPPNTANPPYPSGTPQPGQYPPQQPGQYPPQQPGQYPPQQPGQYPPGQYPPGQYPPGQYPPQQPGQYPPQQPGQYPPQQPGQYPQYPPQQPGQYPPPQPGQYPPQQPGQYPPQQPGQYPPGQYPPQQPGQYPPQQPGVPPNPAGPPYPQGPQPGAPGYGQQPYNSQYPQQQYPPQNQQPGAPPNSQYPPQVDQRGQYYPPPQQPGVPPQQYGYPAPPQGPHAGYPPQQQQAFGQHPQGYAPPQQQQAAVASATFKQDIADINKAAKGFGCDEKAVIKILGTRNAPTIDAIRNNFRKETKKDLVSLLEKELSGHLETVCMATALGREESEAFWARRALKGVGTDEVLLTEALSGKKNAEIETIKKAYRAKYFVPLQEDLKGDLSGKTEKLFLMAIEGQRQEDWIQPDPNMVTRDVDLLHMATEARLGTDEIQVFTVFTRSNEAHLRAVAYAYQQAHRKSLAEVIKKEFSGHQEDALLYILEGAIDKPRRDAELLEEAMKGFGTKDVLLMSRIVRIHWDQYHLEAVKKAYYNLYHRDLIVRVKGETSGNYEKMLVTLLGGV